MTAPDKITLSYTEKVEYIRADLVGSSNIWADEHGLYLDIVTKSGKEVHINLLDSRLFYFLSSEQIEGLRYYHKEITEEL